MQSSLVTAWRTWCRIFARIEEIIIVLLMSAMVLVTFSQVIARYVFNSGWIAALELTQLLFAWLILFGASYGIKEHAHLGVDIILQKCPPKIKRLLLIFACVATICWAAILLESGWISWIFGTIDRGGSITYIQKMHSIGISTEDLDIPRSIAYIILPISLLLIIWRTLVVCYQAIKNDPTAQLINSHTTKSH